MESREERYKNDAEQTNTRSRLNRNQDLYKSIYDGNEYKASDQIEIDTKEIDLNAIREKNFSREDYLKTKDYKSAISIATIEEEPIFDEEKEEDRIYDINSIIEKAKQNRQLDEDEYNKLKNTQYDILRKLNINNKNLGDTEETKEQQSETAKEELKTLIDTVTSSEFKTCTGMLEDLMPDNENTVITESFVESLSTSTTSIKTSVLDEDDSDDDDDSESNEEFKTEKIDKSFYTGGYKFTKDDIEGMENIEKAVKGNNTLIRILLFLLGVILTIVVLFVANNYISL